MTTLRAVLTAARDRLLAAGIADEDVEAEIEAEVLLRHALHGVSRAQLYAHLEDSVDSAAADDFESLLTRRLAHEPTAYITGHREFYGLDFVVTPDVLIPRPETELLVERAIALCKDRATPRIADAGTGSGAIAVALATALPAAEIYATDVSRAALAVAAENAKACGVNKQIDFGRSDLLESICDYVDLVAANLPYVTTVEWRDLPPELRDHEPRLALDGGVDGLDLIRRLVPQALRLLRPHGALLLEVGEGHAEALRKRFPDLTLRTVRDGLGVERVVEMRPHDA